MHPVRVHLIRIGSLGTPPIATPDPIGSDTKKNSRRKRHDTIRISTMMTYGSSGINFRHDDVLIKLKSRDGRIDFLVSRFGFSSYSNYENNSSMNCKIDPFHRFSCVCRVVDAVFQVFFTFSLTHHLNASDTSG